MKESDSSEKPYNPTVRFLNILEKQTEDDESWMIAKAICQDDEWRGDLARAGVDLLTVDERIREIEFERGRR